MSDIISLIGIVVGLVILIYLAFKGYSIVWVAPVCAIVVAAFGCKNLLGTYMGDFMNGLANFICTNFPLFFLGAVFGKIMDITGAARSLANKLVKLIGSKYALLAVVLPCLLMTYGGISLFVVVFVIYPMGYAIYREADLPRQLLPGAIAYGAFGITMTAIPGSPQVQNLIPTQYYATTAAAAPLLGLVAAVLIGVPGYIYLYWKIRKARKEGRHFEEDPKYKAVAFDETKHPSWHWLSCLLPLILVVVVLNVLPTVLVNAGIVEAMSANEAVILALVAGIVLAILMNLYQIKEMPNAISEGAESSMPAIMNTACAVGFGSVVKSVGGFTLLKNAMLNMPGSILFSEAVAVNVLAGATGSATGGLGIALDALGKQYMAAADAMGVSYETLHRIASLASGGLDTLPHNGAVLTLLAVSHCSHKESYWDVCVTSCIIPVVVSLSLGLAWGLFI